jgi:iron-sulfur cluster repair protein YtfE (RIC family)
MSDITKVLRDDHARLKRLFLRANQASEDVSIALDVVDELNIQSAIKEEIVFPALAEIDSRLAEESEEELEEIKDMAAEIEDLDLDDPAVVQLMTQLKKAVTRHVEKQEGTMFPVLERGLPDQLLELGSQAFAMRQELLGSRPPRRSMWKSATANMGFANKRKTSATTNMGF